MFVDVSIFFSYSNIGKFQENHISEFVTNTSVVVVTFIEV